MLSSVLTVGAIIVSHVLGWLDVAANVSFEGRGFLSHDWWDVWLTMSIRGCGSALIFTLGNAEAVLAGPANAGFFVGLEGV